MYDKLAPISSQLYDTLVNPLLPHVLGSKIREILLKLEESTNNLPECILCFEVIADKFNQELQENYSTLAPMALIHSVCSFLSLSHKSRLDVLHSILPYSETLL